MKARKGVAALGGLLALGAVAYAQSADTFKVTGFGAEARFVLIDSETGVQTTIVVFAASQSALDPPQQGGPLNQPFTIIDVRQETADGNLLLAASYGGSDIVPIFETQGRDFTSATVAGTVLMEVSTPETISATGTLVLTFQATGRAVHETDTDTLVIPGGFVQSSHVNGFHSPATATGTLTIDGTLPPPMSTRTFQLSSSDAEVQRNNSGLITVVPGATL